MFEPSDVLLVQLSVVLSPESEVNVSGVSPDSIRLVSS
jgi:hypothetical protein